MPDLAPRALRRALTLLEGTRDILGERVVDARAPTWVESRGLTDFLAGLDDAELARCEEAGLAARLAFLPGAPASLVELAHEVTAAAWLPRLSASASASGSGAAPAARRGVGDRKLHQLAALVELIGPMAARGRRIVDVGAGKGHFGRVASEKLGAEVLGLERDAGRVASALALAGVGSQASFLCVDVLAEPIPLGPEDLAVGLHACGEIGDRTASAAAEVRADLALVSCCLQKIRAPSRTPLSAAAQGGGMTLKRETLGLSNLTARPMGVERSLADTTAGREHRIALRLLLEARGVEVEPGEELRGINRRQAMRGLERIATPALSLRGLPSPTAAELARAAAEARVRYARMRRWSLPRAMLARLVEVSVSLDRAALLEERGMSVRVGTLVDEGVTARNVVVLASRDESRLPGPCVTLTL